VAVVGTRLLHGRHAKVTINISHCTRSPRKVATESDMIDGKSSGLDRKALKQKYLECFGARATNAETWRETVMRLIEQGVSRGTLLNWAIDAGHPKITVASILSRILVSLGLRERREGAGRKPSPDALELLDHVRVRYGERFLKVLHAAARAAKTQLAAGGSQSEPWDSTARAANAVVISGRNREHCASAIRRGGKPTGRPGRERRQPLRAIFKRNFNTTATVRIQTRRK
jgi:hypothetical protein